MNWTINALLSYSSDHVWILSDQVIKLFNWIFNEFNNLCIVELSRLIHDSISYPFNDIIRYLHKCLIN